MDSIPFKNDLLKLFDQSINKFSLIFKEKDFEIKYQEERFQNNEKQKVLSFFLLLFGFFLSSLKAVDLYFFKIQDIGPSKSGVPIQINLENFLVILISITFEIIIFFVKKLKIFRGITICVASTIFLFYVSYIKQTISSGYVLYLQPYIISYLINSFLLQLFILIAGLLED